MKRLCIFASCFLWAAQLEGRELFFATAEMPGAELIKARTSAIYESLGYEAKFKDFPAARSLIKSNSGEFDGEMARIIGTEKDYPNLIRIKPVFAVTEVFLYGLKNETFTGFPMLTGKKTGHLIGIQLTTKLLEKWPNVPISDPANLFRLLSLGRIDYILVPEIIARNFVGESKTKYSSVKKLSPPAHKMLLYHYLHKKNAAIVNSVSEKIEEMGPLKL